MTTNNILIQKFNELNPYAKAAIFGGLAGHLTYAAQNPQVFVSPAWGVIFACGTVYAKHALKGPVDGLCNDLRLSSMQKKWAKIASNSALYIISTLALWTLGVMGSTLAIGAVIGIAINALYTAKNQHLLPTLHGSDTSSSISPSIESIE